jgi:hypothetical protein
MVRLRAAELHHSPNLRGALGDGQPLAEEVDPAHPQGRHLAEAEPGVGQQPHHVAILPCHLRELLDLAAGEEARFRAACPWQRDVGSRIARDPPVADSKCQYEGQHAVGLANRGRR